MADKSLPTTLQFTETMHGFMQIHQDAANQGEFEKSFQAGKEKNEQFRFLVTIKIDDINKFVADPTLKADITGLINSSYFGNQLAIQKGSSFHLFIDNPQNPLEKKMLYRLFFIDNQGQQRTFFGFKQIQSESNIWGSTTTLYSKVFDGFIGENEDFKTACLSSGILHLTAEDFSKQLMTFQTTGQSYIDRLNAYVKFGEIFFGNLWQVYSKNLFSAKFSNWNEHPISVNSLEGVSGAQKTIIPFTTDDGLGLSFVRFQKDVPSHDVVLLIHGLTTSSDMFIMPEHYNLVQYLLDHGFSDIWSLDWRGSRRHNYNLQKNSYNLDDVALYDIPKAVETIHRSIDDHVNIHVICHCVGSISFHMSLFAQKLDGIKSVISNSVSLNPSVPMWSYIKLKFAPALIDWVLRYQYLDPRWSILPGPGKVSGWLLSKIVSLMHPECRVPTCHMLSFMWGTGNPACFEHDNLQSITHERLGDLFGGVGANYYRHIKKMARNKTAVKYDARQTKYSSLPDYYLQNAADIDVPILFVTGSNNKVFGESNIDTFHILNELQKNPENELAVIDGYGHQDIYMGKNVAVDVFPTFLEFLDKHRATDTLETRLSA